MDHDAVDHWKVRALGPFVGRGFLGKKRKEDEKCRQAENISVFHSFT
jgi:hypothetical protein